ncbi:hypothetical protein NBRC10512v2_006689 [Rhodotorula toruloides]|uniref:Uncharacterized protein n=1 Tax=Rhodotorula toruloides (strain NP11) TaxID=1130832 RepID=M7WML4_RHOT1|nr:uncharacterized protein RHTO_01384 [Rhodotorula toruloides NP11]EMS21737.1 hypothetical protein RHTO_01384 [Rhodotorula toruloides NP11]
MSTGTPTATALPTYDSTLGAFVIGTMLAFFLQGFTLFETIVFFSNCRKSREPWWYIVTVVVVLLIDLLHTAFSLNTIWLWAIENYGNPSILALSPWSFTAEPVLTGTQALIVHVFYALRIYGVSDAKPGGRIIALVVTALSMFQFGFASAVTSKIVEYDREFVRFAGWLWGAYFHYINQVSNSMAGPFERSSKTVIKVALIILMTNGLSASAAVIATVLFGSFRHANWHAIAQLCLAKLLALSLLIALNARTLLADMLGVDAGTFYSIGARPTKKAPIMYNGVYVGSGSQPDGIYGRAAGASFDALGKTLRSPGPNSSFNHGGIVEGEGGVVYPISVLRQGASLENGKDGDGTVSRASSFAEKEPISFDDELEHGSRSRQPFARATSDQTLPAPTIDHPYSNV